MTAAPRVRGDGTAGAPRPLTLLLLLALLARGPAPAFAAVDDSCSPGAPCAPDLVTGLPLFCDFKIGPEAGGRCQVCQEADPLSYCNAFEPKLSKMGEGDCRFKCGFRACEEPCAAGEFCNHYNLGDETSCQNCQTLIVHPNECKSGDFRFPAEGVAACEETCGPKTCAAGRHCLVTHPTDKFFCDLKDAAEGEEAAGTCAPCAGMAAIEECAARSSSERGRELCVETCAQTIITRCDAPAEVPGVAFGAAAAAVGDAACAALSPTTKDAAHLCNADGECEVCPGRTSGSGPDAFHAEDCFTPGSWPGITNETAQSCVNLCHTMCFTNRSAYIEVGGLGYKWDTEKQYPMRAMLGTKYKDATGPLVDCGMGGTGECLTNATEGFMCLISRGARKFSDKVLNCEEDGGVGAIMYNNQPDVGFVAGGVGDAPTAIAITSISMEDGLDLLEKGLGMDVRLNIQETETNCNRGCSDRLPCPGENSYCQYQFGNLTEGGTHGYCKECLEDEDEDEQRVQCFLSGLPIKGAMDCAATCDSTFVSRDCKICGEAVTGDLLLAKPDEPVCNFCPGRLDKAYNDRVIPFMGEDATCFNVDRFFQNAYVAETNPNCKLALGFNYICGCEGPGYAGADTQAKRRALVWVPRTSAILSLLGSLAIVVDVFRDKVKRKTPYGQLMIAMSVFDFLGSAGYSLTSLPIPSEYSVEGAQGNDATCTAQGFFIQMGTIAAFINVSLAVYYFFVIQKGWGDTRIMEIRHWFFLVPVVVGLAFACAGLYNIETGQSNYEMLFFWCNNGAKYWPDIPVLLAIFFTTCTMASVYYDVWKTEQASKRSANNNSAGTAQQTMSSKIFWQSVWYLSSFYVTWVPYIVLQLIWATGQGYTSYGWILLATMLVPLQGFWNAIVYFRRRAKKRANEMFSVFRSRFTTAGTGTGQGTGAESSTKKSADVSRGASGAASRGPSAVSQGVSVGVSVVETGGGEA